MNRQRRLLLAALSAAWVGMVLACGGVDHAQVQKTLDGADASWDHGEKADAVREYRTVYADALTAQKEKILPRIVEFEMGKGDANEAKTWIKRGLADKINVVYTDPAAKELFAAAQQEEEKAAAQAKADAAERERKEKERKADEEAKAKTIPYEVLEKRTKSDGQVILAVLVDEKASKEDVIKLAESLWQKGDLFTLDVFDSRVAYDHSVVQARTGQPDGYPEKEMSRHWLVQAIPEIDNGFRR